MAPAVPPPEPRLFCGDPKRHSLIPAKQYLDAQRKWTVFFSADPTPAGPPNPGLFFAPKKWGLYGNRSWRCVIGERELFRW